MKTFFEQLFCRHDYVVIRKCTNKTVKVADFQYRRECSFEGIVIASFHDNGSSLVRSARLRRVARRVDAVSDRICSKCLKTKLRLKKMKLAALAKINAKAVIKLKKEQEKMDLDERRKNAIAWGRTHINLADKA